MKTMVLIVFDLVQDYFNPALWPNSHLPESRQRLVKAAFFQTELDAVLGHLQPHTLVLAGITTAWCVPSTAVDAYQRDYDEGLISPLPFPL